MSKVRGAAAAVWARLRKHGRLAGVGALVLFVGSLGIFWRADKAEAYEGVYTHSNGAFYLDPPPGSRYQTYTTNVVYTGSGRAAVSSTCLDSTGGGHYPASSSVNGTDFQPGGDTYPNGRGIEIPAGGASVTVTCDAGQYVYSYYGIIARPGETQEANGTGWSEGMSWVYQLDPSAEDPGSRSTPPVSTNPTPDPSSQPSSDPGTPGGSESPSEAPEPSGGSSTPAPSGDPSQGTGGGSTGTGGTGGTGTEPAYDCGVTHPSDCFEEWFVPNEAAKTKLSTAVSRFKEIPPISWIGDLTTMSNQLLQSKGDCSPRWACLPDTTIKLTLRGKTYQFDPLGVRGYSSTACSLEGSGSEEDPGCVSTDGSFVNVLVRLRPVTGPLVWVAVYAPVLGWLFRKVVPIEGGD